MKKSVCFTLLFIVISAACSCTYAVTIRIVSDEWMPYTGYQKNNEGYLIDIFRTIFEKKGYMVEAASLPWSRAVIEARNGKYEAIAGAYRTDVPDFIFPDIEQGLGTDIFITTNSSKWRYKGIHSLPQITLGVVNDYSYGTAIDGYIENHKNDPAKIHILYGDDSIVLRMIALIRAERISAFIENKDVINYTLAHNNIRGLREAGSRGSDRVYIAFTPSHPKARDYARILSEGMRELRQSGELQRILSKYSLDDWYHR